MNAFIEASADEHVKELASYMAAQLGDGGKALLQQCEPLLAAKQLAMLLTLLVDHCRVLLTTEGVTDDQVQSVFNSIAHLVDEFKPENTKALVQKLAATLGSPQVEGRETTRLRLLGNLFNSLDRKSSSRLDVFIQILTYTGHLKQIETVLSQLQNLDTWLAEWNASLEETRTLYKQLCTLLKQRRPEEMLQYLVKFLRTYNGASAAELASVAADARLLVATSLMMRSKFDLFHVTQLDAVKNLKDEPLIKVLHAFTNGDIAEYHRIAASNPEVFEQHGLQQEDVLHRIRLNALAILCAEKSDLSYADIAAKLSVDEDTIEFWVIDVIRAGLVEAKVDAIARTIHVTRATKSSFSSAQWQELRDVLQEWKHNISEVQRVLDDVKLQVQMKSKSGGGGKGGAASAGGVVTGAPVGSKVNAPRGN